MAIKINNQFSDIVESGNNSNGSWVKFSNGFMICNMSRSFDLQFITAWGSMYELPERISLGNYPQKFVGLPTLSVTAIDNAAVIESINNRTNTTIGNINLMRPVYNSSVSVLLHITAMGKWK